MNNSNIQQSYTKNYLRIYAVQILSIMLRFLSFFIVSPYITADRITYGIYTVCISVTIFLGYADLGFVSAGTKYAAECFSRGEKEEEISLIGFSNFILFIFVLIISGVFLFLSIKPEILIKDLDFGYQRDVACKLLLILAISSPLNVIHRTLQMIFNIRLQEYYITINNIVGSFFTIISVFYFFGNGHYNIVGYFLFSQIISFLVLLAGIIQAKNKYNYNFYLLFKHFKFSKKIFNYTKNLAFSSLFVTIFWILYYEMDSIAIVKFISIEAVATYAIGLSFLGFFRTFLGTIFSPFSARFNHFIGLGKEDELKSFYNHVMIILLPLVVFPIIALIIMAKGITISWVGQKYTESVIIVQILLACNVLGFISYPTGLILIAKEKIKMMYIINTLMPVLFWAGILFTVKYLGIKSFAIFKLMTFIINGVFSLWFSLKFTNVSIWKFIKNIIIPYIPGLLVMGIILWFLRDIFITDKNKLNLLYNLIFTGIGCLAAFAVSFLTAKQFRQYIVSLLSKLNLKYQRK